MSREVLRDIRVEASKEEMDGAEAAMAVQIALVEASGLAPLWEQALKARH